MEKNKLDWIISILREQMVAGAGGFTSSSDPKGPTAGFDPVISLKKRKKFAFLGNGSRKRWMKK